MELAAHPLPDPESLLALLRGFAVPGGEASVRGVRAVRVAERGEIRASAAAPWSAFTAEKTLEATRSGFRWRARIATGRVKLVHVVDEYVDGRGALVVKLGGIVPLSRFEGADADVGELQRYLGELAQCPPALFLHRGLEWTAAGPRTLRVRDRGGPAAATVDLDVCEEGRVVRCRADRPRLVGKRAVVTPFVGTCGDFEEREGLRVARHVEAAWALPEGPLTYFRGELASFELLR